MTKHSPFKYFKTSPEIIRLAVMLYVRFPLPLRNVEDLLHERGIDICHETVRYWWLRFGPMFAAEIKKRRIQGLKSSPHQAEPHRRSHRVARSLRGIRASVTVLAEIGSNLSGSTGIGLVHIHIGKVDGGDPDIGQRDHLAFRAETVPVHIPPGDQVGEDRVVRVDHAVGVA